MKKEIKKHNTSLIATFFILVVFGLIMLASASSVVGFINFGDNYYYFKHQFLFGLLPGLFLFFLCSKIPYKFWQKNAVWILFVSLILLILVFAPKIGLELNKSKSWINFGAFSLQPSEIAKLGLIIYLAAWFAKSKENIKSFSHGFLPFLILLGVIIALIALQPDIGTMVIIVVIAIGIYCVAGLKWSYFFWLILAGAGLLAFLIKIDPDGRRLNRIIAFLNPTFDTQDIGYHINQALLAVGSGGWLGLGLGKSLQKFEYLPEVSGDSIFAIMAEELGFIFSTLFIILLFYFVFKILKTAKFAPDDFAKLFAIGMALWIGGQAIFNIGAMLGLLPLTGVPLPFVSFGGTALMILMAGSGILVNINKKVI
ncbi:putative lipid II flippase FtsW [Candidatus Parcubacteria bacterium]|nr:putative lipid II flippase FtsW [Patescibacteria group bacterium]MBU4481856.1 putative lipid II flippase FtsW [Patescibacteria group bacterium]MCG2686571.1 putative lipid II flippase FtsW [Candidatus Parcubacteria bacterium]